MEIRNLDAVLVAEVLGIELAAPLRESEVDAIETAWRERLVVPFSENFGELDPPGPNPYGEPFNKAHPRSTSSPT
jgi:taurine dioxygenase